METNERADSHTHHETKTQVKNGSVHFYTTSFRLGPLVSTEREGREIIDEIQQRPLSGDENHTEHEEIGRIALFAMQWISSRIKQTDNGESKQRFAAVSKLTLT
jgi:hypothetical protein